MITPSKTNRPLSWDRIYVLVRKSELYYGLGVAIDGWRPFLVFGGAMNISQLEYLVSAIHLGSYSRAAKEQFVTPQAVSKAIRTLESELGL
mgnify:CR=1 FL=1